MKKETEVTLVFAGDADLNSLVREYFLRYVKLILEKEQGLRL